MKIAIIGSGLAGLTAAVNLIDEGHEVEIYESRSFWGGKVGSWEDKDGNHIEMGLHVFFYNYANLFKLMKKVGALDNLLPKEHTHLFINNGGDLKSLDFRFALGAPFNGLKAFFTTEQLTWVDKLRNALALGTSPIVRGLVDYEGAMKIIRDLDKISFKEWFLNHGGSLRSLERMWDPIAYALGFINCKDISARCMLTIFMMFASKTEASKLNLLKGSPHKWLTKPIVDYITKKGCKIHLNHKVDEIIFKKESPSYSVTQLKISTPEGIKSIFADTFLAACDVPGIKKIVPKEWYQFKEFEGLKKLRAVAVATIQLRYDGWVTELNNNNKSQNPTGLDNLLYSADASFSCFADLALASPTDYRKEGMGSLLQCVLTPGDRWMGRSTERITKEIDAEVRSLFPSSKNLKLLWSNVVQVPQSLYRESPGMDPYRPDQKTSISNFFMAGSYTKQDYIDSMEGATMSGHLAAAAILDKKAELAKNLAVS
ncbi:9,9'-di-cis-zeta-carotene desaturase [Prochlorococcus sp. AH-716-E13]|nr:9,9'-di-cis-zeta-carotene desaturase [Prochlorococcus sp. AH-716-E13]